MQTKLGKDNCHYCGTLLDAATSTMGEYIPEPGDVSVCLKCANYLQYSDDMAVIKLSKEVFELLSPQLQIQLRKIKSAILDMKVKAN